MNQIIVRQRIQGVLKFAGVAGQIGDGAVVNQDVVGTFAPEVDIAADHLGVCAQGEGGVVFDSDSLVRSECDTGEYAAVEGLGLIEVNLRSIAGHEYVVAAQIDVIENAKGKE